MARVNFVIDQGRTFTAQVLLTDQNGANLNVTGYTSNAAMRKHFGSSNVTFIHTALANGLMTVSMTANQTSVLDDGRYVYDAAIFDASNTVVQLIEGMITVKPAAYHWWADANAATYSANVANNSF